MASTGQKWLIGCGFGCLLLVLLVAALMVGSCYMIRTATREFAQIETQMDTLRERYGEITDFSPTPDGTIEAARLEAFLSVREEMAPVRAEMHQSLAVFSEDEDENGDSTAGGMLDKVRAGFGLLPGFIEFYTAKNEALLASGMGLGEYYYIYSVAYYSWLGNSPADGPPYRIVSHGTDYDRGRPSAIEVREERLEDLRAHLHSTLLPMLRAQLAHLEENPDNDAWRQVLVEELAALEADRRRLLWQDGVPEVLESSLEPFRERLEASYDELCNPLEVLFQLD